MSGVTIRHREKMGQRPEYVIVGGRDEDEWIRMEWKSDVPTQKRRSNSLLVELEEYA